MIVTLDSLLLRLFLCKDNTKYISYLCTLYSISGNECISKEGRYVMFTYRIGRSDNAVDLHRLYFAGTGVHLEV